MKTWFLYTYKNRSKYILNTDLTLEMQDIFMLPFITPKLYQVFTVHLALFLFDNIEN